MTIHGKRSTIISRWAILSADIHLVTILAAVGTASEIPPLEINTSTYSPLDQFHLNRSVRDPNGTNWRVKENENYQGYECQLGRPCLRKCCPKDQVMVLKGCVPYSAARPWFKPVVMDDDGRNARTVEGEEYFTLFQGKGCKHEKMLVDPEYDSEHEFFLRASDGHLSIPKLNELIVKPVGFCLEYFPRRKKYMPYLCYGDPNKTEIEEFETLCQNIKYTIYPIGMFISVIFLTISFFIYACIPELRNLHGKCLLCHIASLETAYIFLILVQVLENYLPREMCIFSAFAIYFSSLSTFLWLNIMCIDMSISFSGLKAMPGTIQERDKKKFLLYVLYAWGIPLAILCFSMVMEFGPIPDNLLRPQFGNKCWFESNKSWMAYFIGPVAAIITVNIGLFLFTATMIFKLKKGTAMLKRGRRHKNEVNRQRFNLYLKLFIVMGVSWALEIISWAVGGSVCIWIPTDLLNALQGVLLFFIFVWKDQIRRKVLKRLCPSLATKISRKATNFSNGKSNCSVSSSTNDGDNTKLSGAMEKSSENTRTT